MWWESQGKYKVGSGNWSSSAEQLHRQPHVLGEVYRETNLLAGLAETSIVVRDLCL